MGADLSDSACDRRALLNQPADVPVVRAGNMAQHAAFPQNADGEFVVGVIGFGAKQSLSPGFMTPVSPGPS